MKKFLYFVCFCTCTLLWSACNPPTIATGSIYGIVRDKATGEPIRNAGVELKPLGVRSTTGSDGQFEFLDIPYATYKLEVTKTGYQPVTMESVIVNSESYRKRVDIQLEKLPQALRIVDANGQDISFLNFGAEKDVTTRTFSIFNDGPTSLKWTIDEDCPWLSVKSIDGEQMGKLAAGEQEPIKVTIERNKLGEGLNSYILNINSDKGSKELTITAGEDVYLPKLTTEPITNITATSATFNATITDIGNPAYTERGFVYGKSPQPTTANNLNKLTAATNNKVEFTATATGLNASETYYVRAYAVSSLGTAYGNDIVFTTGSVATVLSTSAVTNVSAYTATFNATITIEGSPVYTEKGFCYNTNQNTLPTIADNKRAVNGFGAGNYSLDVSNLDLHVTYYVRAYAIQNGEPIYGNTVYFTTKYTETSVVAYAATDITTNSVVLHGAIREVGDPAYTEKGFCYVVSNNGYGNEVPTLSNTKIVVTGNGVGDFSQVVTGLQYNKTYVYRAYAIQNGSVIYSPTKQTFKTDYTAASVITNDIVINNYGSITLHGSVTNWGNPRITERGFCYTTEQYYYPTISDTKVVVPLTASSDYTKTVTGLTDNQYYSVRAYVIQDGVAIYGAEKEVTTPDPPEVLTGRATIKRSSDGLTTTVTLNAVFMDANPNITEFGFVYANSGTPTVTTGTIVQGANLKLEQDNEDYPIYSFSKKLTNPTGAYLYYRAYVKTRYGYIYGEVENICLLQ